MSSPPTHVLVIEVPLNLDNGKGDFDPIHDTIATALNISRAAYVGSICGDPQVSLRDERT